MNLEESFCECIDIWPSDRANDGKVIVQSRYSSAHQNESSTANIILEFFAAKGEVA